MSNLTTYTVLVHDEGCGGEVQVALYRNGWGYQCSICGEKVDPDGPEAAEIEVVPREKAEAIIYRTTGSCPQSGGRATKAGTPMTDALSRRRTTENG